MSSLFTQTHKLRNEKGAAAVEFALIASILFMFVFGIIEFGRIFSELEVMNSAAREGARAAAVRGTAADVESAVEAAAAPYALDGAPAADKVCSDTTSGEPVTVSWNQNLEISVGILPEFNEAVEIKGVFRCE
ncbi:MAG TPA: TadE/TadG family type IV pilus assembly protein [Actinomycetota bacterium]|nr:TadE/TadG family type IV pilus assembly protein [Actinomycetota bacterium]